MTDNLLRPHNAMLEESITALEHALKRGPIDISRDQLGVVLLRYETATLGCRALASGRNVMEALFGLALQLRQVTQ